MDQKTIDAYNKMAREYDEETADFWERFPRTILDSFAYAVRSANGAASILDVGSGPGRDGLLLREKGLEVSCIDASEEMVKSCKEKGLEAAVADFNELPFQDASFAGVWAYTSLLHVPKAGIDKPFAEMARVLKPGGILGLGLIEGDWEGYRKSSGMGIDRWFSFYGKDEVEALFAKHGFEAFYFEQFKPGAKNYLNYICRKR